MSITLAPIYNEVPRLFSALNDPFFSTPMSSVVSLRNGAAKNGPDSDAIPRPSFRPSFDVRETDKEFLLEGELPGLDKGNLEIEFVDLQTLRIKGHVDRRLNFDGPEAQNEIPSEGASPKEAAADKPASSKPRTVYLSVERLVGDFSRTFKFPSQVDTSKVTAALKNGLLSIQVPKLEESAKIRKIMVTSE